MPATAGRVRMPANNRVHSSAALQTHAIWQSAIGYDPYAPNRDDNKKASQSKSSNTKPEGENAYESFRSLIQQARITRSNADEARGCCKTCGRVGHLTYQCRNFLSIKDDKEKNSDAIQAAVSSELEKLEGTKLSGKTADEGSEEESEDESESSDSGYDSEMERFIAKRYGTKFLKGKSSRKKDKSANANLDSGERQMRGRSKERSRRRSMSYSDGEDDSGRKRRRDEKRKRTDDSTDDDQEHTSRRRKSRREKRRRRSHRHSDDVSDASGDSSRRHRSRKATSSSSSDTNGSED